MITPYAAMIPSSVAYLRDLLNGHTGRRMYVDFMGRVGGIGAGVGVEKGKERGKIWHSTCG